ncbi:MAG TPA: HAMP domain-containing sensor histidine kinase [Candidatus Baltobacteraceae bacterium]|nr:HAMP domain-containing sensor histidine kinase [Candidatus Baltobacteraceae bacterium]
MIARLALRYLLVFAIVLAALSAGAYLFLGREYAGLLQPALGTPEASRAYAAAMWRVLLTIVAFDVPLLVIVGAAAWMLARASLEPLIAAHERERAFAADAAHALRSPLATIASVAQAERADAPPALAQALTTIARAALDASATVGDLLTLARSAQPGALAKEPIDLGAVVADTAQEYRHIAADRGLRLDVEPASVIVEADERRVREMIRNLLSNAIRHARSTVRVRVDAGPQAQIVVTNDGDPVAADAKARIFDRFFRADGRSDGTGLGLAIVQWIACAHGGSVMVRDGERGTGAEFVVRLPALRLE